MVGVRFVKLAWRNLKSKVVVSIKLHTCRLDMNYLAPMQLGLTVPRSGWNRLEQTGSDGTKAALA